jgi:hypothetical protein
LGSPNANHSFAVERELAARSESIRVSELENGLSKTHGET